MDKNVSRGSATAALDKKSKGLYFALCGNFIVLGIATTIFGATIPRIIEGYKWSYFWTGFVLASGSLGAIIGNLTGGVILSRVSTKAILACGLTIAALGLGLFGLSPDPLINSLLNLLIGLGGGFAEVITNSTIVRLEKRGQSRLMNLMHAAFAVGAVTGPLSVGIVAATHIPFTAVFIGAAFIQLAILAVLLTQNFPSMKASVSTAVASSAVAGENERGPTGLGVLLKKPILLVLSLAMLLYVGVELAMSNWVAEFFVRFRDASDSFGALMVSVFWVGLFVGRLSISIFYHGSKQERLLAILACSSVVCFVSTIAVPSLGVAIAATFLTGLAFSGIYPAIMVIVSAVSGGSTAAIGACATAGGIGVYFFPLAIGLMAQGMGLANALLVTSLFVLALAAISLWLLRRARRQAT